MKTFYHFKITDNEGLWGEVKSQGLTAIHAKLVIVDWLEHGEVVPYGTLGKEYSLEYTGVSEEQDTPEE